jgi:hypothetical protein
MILRDQIGQTFGAGSHSGLILGLPYLIRPDFPIARIPVTSGCGNPGAFTGSLRGMVTSNCL